MVMSGRVLMEAYIKLPIKLWYGISDIRNHIVNTSLQTVLPAHFTSHTCNIKLHNYLFDLNFEHGLPNPLGYLDSSAVLSFHWGHYRDLSNLYCIANSLAKLHSTTSASYTVITNNEAND
jgi:hypothetical protein